MSKKVKFFYKQKKMNTMVKPCHYTFLLGVARTLSLIICDQFQSYL